MDTRLAELLAKHHLTFHWDPEYPGWYLTKPGESGVNSDIFDAQDEDAAIHDAIDYLVGLE